MVLVSHTTSLTASASAITTSVILVSALISSLTGLIILISTLCLRTMLVALILRLITTHLTEECVNELLCLSVISALSFLLLLFLGNPHLDRDGLCTAKQVLLVKLLDSFLSISNSIVHNVSILRFDFYFIEPLNRSIQFERNNFGIFREGKFLSQLFLCDI